MEPQDFDRFDDNTFAITISLAEYRYLVREQASKCQEIDDITRQIDEVTSINSELVQQIQLLQDAVMADDT